MKTNSEKDSKNNSNSLFSQGQQAFFSPKSTFFSPRIQTKLEVGSPNDRYEQEADAIAEKVMRKTENPTVSAASPTIQRKCAACEEEEKIQKKEEEKNEEIEKIQSNAGTSDDENNTIQRKCAECEKEEKLQRKSDSDGGEASKSVENSLYQSKGGGFGMDKSTKAQMESAFNSDFSEVKIHTDSSAIGMNQQLRAKAFTHQNDIYFNSGNYDTTSTDGKKLLAHELTHVVQQTGQINKEGEKPKYNSNKKVSSLFIYQIHDHIDKSITTTFNVMFSDGSTNSFQLYWDVALGEIIDINKSYEIEGGGGLGHIISSKQDSRQFSLILLTNNNKIKSTELDGVSSEIPAIQVNIDDMRIINNALEKSKFPLKVDYIEIDDTADASGKGLPAPSPVSEKPILSFTLPDWFKELKEKINAKIDLDKKTLKDFTNFPEKIYYYGSDKVQNKRGKDAWTIEVEKANKEAYYTILKKQYDDVGDKDVFVNKTVAILYDKVGLMLTNAGFDNLKEVFEIDGTGAGKNKFKKDGSEEKANPMSGLKKEQIEKLKELFKLLAGETDPNKKPETPPIPLSSNDIKALLALADDPNKEKIIELLKAKSVNGKTTSSKTLEELIATAKILEAYKRFGIKNDGKGEKIDPIVNRPVQGKITQADPLIVASKGVSFGFETKNMTDALRIPWVYIRWNAYTDSKKNDEKSPAPKDWKTDNWNHYIENQEQGLMNNKHFKTEFPAEGIYTVEAIVEHNYFLPNIFRTSVKVLDEKKVLIEKEDKVYKGFLESGTTKDDDFGQLSYGKGTVTTGKLDKNFKGVSTEEQLKIIDAEIKKYDDIITEYKKRGGAEGEAMVEWGEKYKAKLQTNRDKIAKTAEDKEQKLVACRGTYVSRTEGVKTADLKLTCFVKKGTKYFPPSGINEFEEGTYEDGFHVTLHDSTQLYENDNYEFTEFASTSEAAMKAIFTRHSEAYPDGFISVAFQKYDDKTNDKTDDYIKYTRITDTIGKKIKKVAFSTPVNIAVNVISVILTVFPPTAGIGLGLGITYNSLQTVSEMQELADKGTLTGTKVTTGCGSMLLDILPVVGSFSRTAKLVKIGTKTYYLVKGADLAANGLLVYETGIEQVEKLRTDYFLKIAELDEQIAELKDANPSNPEIDDLMKKRQGLMDGGRDATFKVFSEMAGQQLILYAGAKLLHGIHENYSAKSKLEATTKIVEGLTGVNKLNDTERLALADKIYDNDVKVVASKETKWTKEGDSHVLEIADNATHAEIDALLNNNPNKKPDADVHIKPTGEDENPTTDKDKSEAKPETTQPKEEPKTKETSPVEAEGKTPVTATNEVHEHRIHKDGSITRCSKKCMQLAENTATRANEISALFGKTHQNAKDAKALKEKAKKLEIESKEAAKIKDKDARKTKREEILEKAKQLEIELATLEKAMYAEIDSRIGSTLNDIDMLLNTYPEYKLMFEERINNRNNRRKEINKNLANPDPTIREQALKELRDEQRNGKILLKDIGKHAENMKKPDIRGQYSYSDKETNNKGDYVKTAEGELGVPGQVMKHRNQTEQAKVSGGSGDDAGHLIANVFGAAGDAKNLGKQNWKANEFGTWRKLEIMWAQKLLAGTKVKVKIREVAKTKGDRPYMREATWTEIDVNGNETHHKLIFGNFTSEKSRKATNQAPTPDVPAEGGMVFFWNEERSKRGLDPVYSTEEINNALKKLSTEAANDNAATQAANDNDEL